MPIFRIAGRAHAHRFDDLDERIRVVGGPEADGPTRKVNVVGKVVPVPWLKLDAPLSDTVDVPSECVVGRALFAVD